jgi:hypothetical protein
VLVSKTAKLHQLVIDAQEVAEIRRWHSANIAFGEAMHAAGFRYNHQDRAALINIAKLVDQHGGDQVSDWIRGCPFNSPQHVWRNCLQRRVSKTPATPMPVAPVSTAPDDDDVPMPAPARRPPHHHARNQTAKVKNLASKINAAPNEAR